MISMSKIKVFFKIIDLVLLIVTLNCIAEYYYKKIVINEVEKIIYNVYKEKASHESQEIIFTPEILQILESVNNISGKYHGASLLIYEITVLMIIYLISIYSRRKLLCRVSTNRYNNYKDI